MLPSGKRLTRVNELARIEKLALPPAWKDVWICSDPHGHLQATGYDAKGRKQYRYAARWRAARDDVKYHDLLDFAAQLPELRRRLKSDLRREGLNHRKVLAAVVSLLEETGARVGNSRYREENGSFGLTTLLDRHAQIAGSRLLLSFRGKGGKPYQARVPSARLSRIVRACRDVPGQRLFQYVDDAGGRKAVESGDVNAYIQSVSSPRFTAKTFRTWVASVAALAQLRAIEPAPKPSARKQQLNQALSRVAERLGNTLAICRKSYVHPAIVAAFLSGDLAPRRGAKRSGLNAHECDLVALLQTTSHQKAAA